MADAFEILTFKSLDDLFSNLDSVPDSSPVFIEERLSKEAFLAYLTPISRLALNSKRLTIEGCPFFDYASDTGCQRRPCGSIYYERGWMCSVLCLYIKGVLKP